MNIRQKVFETIESSKIGKRMLNDQRYRTIAAAAFSFFLNLLYALYNGVLGIMNRSVWFIAMCAYYTILSILRFSAVLCGRKYSTADAVDAEYFVMKLSGLLLAVLSFVLTGVVYISLAEDIAVRYDTVVMISIAAYSFYKITMAIIRAVRQRKNSSPLMAVIRSIGYADVAASVLTLQRSMLASFGDSYDQNAHTLNILTGAAACLFIWMLGTIMTGKGIKKGKSIWQNPNSLRQMKKSQRKL